MSKKIGLTKRLAKQQASILARNGKWVEHQLYWCHGDDSDGIIAYGFAKRWSSRDIDLYGLQRLIISSQSAKAAILFARDIKGANIGRLQDVVLKFGSVKQKREFAQKVPGAAVNYLLGIAIVQEVMEL